MKTLSSKKKAVRQSGKEIPSVSAGRRRLPVSRKFYDDLCSRISLSVSEIGGTDETASQIRAAVDIYLDGGVSPIDDENCDILVRMAFALLRPEIDKAVTRSRKARERGLRLKKSPTSREVTRMLADTTQEKMEAYLTGKARGMTGSEEVEIKLNRRERRRMEQLRRRDLRRLAKYGSGCGG